MDNLEALALIADLEGAQQSLEHDFNLFFKAEDAIHDAFEKAMEPLKEQRSELEERETWLKYLGSAIVLDEVVVFDIGDERVSTFRIFGTQEYFALANQKKESEGKKAGVLLSIWNNATPSSDRGKHILFLPDGTLDDARMAAAHWIVRKELPNTKWMPEKIGRGLPPLGDG